MGTSMLAPASATVEAIAARVRQASDERRPLRIAGAGTWKLSAAIDATATIDTAGLDEVIEYVPGDLTITVGAGVTLATIDRVTAEHGQWLTLDPFGSPDGTIGATIATASAGPLGSAFGTPRDVVIGLEAVSGTGSVVRGGGRVVKNVAGFDLTRLFTGSRGVIGAITEVSLRLRARPVVDETVAVTIGSKTNALRDAIAGLRGWPAPPMAAELLDSGTAAMLGLQPYTSLLIRVGGNARAVGAQKRRAGSLGKTAAVPTDVWMRLRALDLDAGASLRLADLPSAFIERWDDVLALAGDGGRAIASPLRGHMRCMLHSVDRAAIHAFRSRLPAANVVFDSLPTPATWNALTTIPDATSLHGRIKDAFDPAGIMNPGAMRLAR